MVDNTKINRDIDTQLMLQLKKGNIKALETIYKKHISDVTNFFIYIGNTDGYSQDLAHEVFLRLWLKRESFRGDSNFEDLLYGLAGNILKEHYRYLRRQAKLKEDLRDSRRNSTSTEPEEAAFYAEQFRLVRENMSKLSKKQRQSIELSLDTDITTKIAARRAYCSYNAFHQRRFAARKKLRKLLEKAEKTLQKV